ncbi:hypothetical protein B0H14DRAFT_3487156 [Mycena olivaceomarginata]|nr:hypothetical protein B0H14DRAFT_3487156 [Mycena olivaceomarginata]
MFGQVRKNPTIGTETEACDAGDTGTDTLVAIQKECTALFKAGLQSILGRTKVAMNYENYIKSLVLGKNIGLMNWLQGVNFKRMSLQSAIGPAAHPL